MKKIALGASLLMLQAPIAFAQAIGEGPTTGGTGKGTPVPEISALEGTAALAVIAAVVLLAWERRRRAY
jgi:hypothetical protein